MALPMTRNPDREMLMLLQKKLNRVIAEMAHGGHQAPDDGTGDTIDDGNGDPTSADSGAADLTDPTAGGDMTVGEPDPGAAEPQPPKDDVSTFFKPKMKTKRPGTVTMIAGLLDKPSKPHVGGGKPPFGGHGGKKA